MSYVPDTMSVELNMGLVTQGHNFFQRIGVYNSIGCYSIHNSTRVSRNALSKETFINRDFLFFLFTNSLCTRIQMEKLFYQLLLFIEIYYLFGESLSLEYIHFNK